MAAKPKKPATKKVAGSSIKKADKPVTAPPVLADVRTQIDGIDRQIQALIAQRAQFAHQVGKAKGKLAAAIEWSLIDAKTFFPAGAATLVHDWTTGS